MHNRLTVSNSENSQVLLNGDLSKF